MLDAAMTDLREPFKCKISTLDQEYNSVIISRYHSLQGLSGLAYLLARYST